MNVVVRIFFLFFFQAHLAGLIPAVDWSDYPDRLNIRISASLLFCPGQKLTENWADTLEVTTPFELKLVEW